MDSHTLALPLELWIWTPTLHVSLFSGKLVKGRFPLQKIKSNHTAITVPKPKSVCAQT